MNNLADIARILIASPALAAPNVLREKLGYDGYATAVSHGWVETDYENGCARVSTRPDRLTAMRSEAAKDAPAAVVTEARGWRGFVGVEVPPAVMLTINEDAPPPAMGAPGGPKVAGAPVGATPPAAVGDEVTVAEAGQTYTARVQACNPDGSCKLTFGGAKPGRDTFKKDEVRVTAKAPANPTGAPASVAA